MVAMPQSMAGKCWRKYEGALRSHPLGTQIATSAILWAAGDCLAQRAETIGHKQKSRFNRRRVLLTGLYGAAIIGPMGHNWYQGLDRAVMSFCPAGSNAAVAAKVAADTFIYTPLNIVLFFTLMTRAVEGGTWQDVKQKLRHDFLPTLGAECCIWPMYQTLNFARVPVQHQLLVCNLGSLLDSTFLCWARVNDGWVKLVLPGLRSPTVTAPISTVTDKVAHVVL